MRDQGQERIAFNAFAQSEAALHLWPSSRRFDADGSLEVPDKWKLW